MEKKINNIFKLGYVLPELACAKKNLKKDNFEKAREAKQRFGVWQKIFDFGGKFFSSSPNLCFQY